METGLGYRRRSPAEPAPIVATSWGHSLSSHRRLQGTVT